MPEQILETTNFFTTQLDKAVGWCRKYSLWPFPFGTACCAIEFMGAVGAHHDIARFGAEAVRFSPRQADLLLVAGTITDKQGPVLRKIYNQMTEPKWVIAMGACASSGGFYRAYHVMQGIDELVPVDVYVPGCPPTPESLLYALKIVQEMAQGNIPRTAQTVSFEEKGKEYFHRPLARWPVASLETRSDFDLASLPAVPRIIAEKFPSEILNIDLTDPNIPAITIKRDKILQICNFLRNTPELDFDLPMDVCGVDYLGRKPRFEVVYHLYSIGHKHRVRLKAPLKENDLRIDSVTSVWKGVDWFEREAFDLFGIEFVNHPNLQKILTHEDFDGFALRKDFDPGQRFLCREAKLDLFTHKDDIANPPLSDIEDPLCDRMVVNFGPSHPITHGVLRLQLELEGETIKRSRSEIGYLHRCFEKMCETHTYHQVIPFTDRLNYCSSFMNNAGWCHAVEQLMGVEVPERAQILRIILSELSRIIDHCVCIGANLVDLGALTNFWYLFTPREEVYRLLEECCGSRLTVSYGRIGGLSKDVPEDFVERCKFILKMLAPYIKDVETLIMGNRIFIDRCKNVGTVSAADAVEWSFTGPCLRASGVEYDVRKAHPYWGYDRFDFEIPVCSEGDVLSRFQIRFEEMRQSMKIIEQAINVLPGGPVICADKEIALPDKNGVYSDIENLMNHFKLIMHGIQPPRGEIYSFTEAANGELGFYIVSDGGKNPYRVKVRPPCFAVYQINDSVLPGHLIADVTAILGAWNVIAGELDR